MLAIPRLVEKIDMSNIFSCWEWLACKNWGGYGEFKYQYKKYKAHRFVYEYFNGPIPDGLHLDHLCRNRGCVNPMHLEPVTNKENCQRGKRHNRYKDNTSCMGGHPYTAESLYITSKGHRQCRICKKAAQERFNNK